MDTVVKKEGIEKFQELLTPIKEAFLKVLNDFEIKDGVQITVTDGKIRTYINYENFRKG